MLTRSVRLRKAALLCGAARSCSPLPAALLEAADVVGATETQSAPHVPAVQQHTQAHRRPFHVSSNIAAVVPFGWPSTAEAASTLVAAQPMEPVLAVISPVVLATQAWELFHVASGLPWWASIPATTVVLRTALLPFTLKAKAASANFLLMQQASAAAGALQAKLRQSAEQEAAGVAAGSVSGVSHGNGEANLRQGLQVPSRWQLTRHYYRYLRKQHGIPSLWWYHSNVFLQVNVFVAMSAALRQMSGNLWPGFTSEGALWFTDLTQPSVVLSSLATPLGINGIFMPLAIVFTYVSSIDHAAAVRAGPLSRLALEMVSLPMFLAALVVPQATLLYWATSSGISYMVQVALGRPGVAARLGLGPRQAGGPPLEEAAVDLMARGKLAEGLCLFERITQLEPQDPSGWEALGLACSHSSEWPRAAHAHSRAAELYAARANAAQQGAALKHAAAAHLSAASDAARHGSGGGDGGSSSTSGAASGDAAGTGAMQEHIQAAVAKMGSAVQVLPHDWEAWYQLAIAHMAARRQGAGLEAVQRAWQLATGSTARQAADGVAASSPAQDVPDNGQRTAGEAALRVAPVALKLVDAFTKWPPKDETNLISAASLATEVVSSIPASHQGAQALQKELTLALQAALKSVAARGGTVEELQVLASRLEVPCA